MAKFIRINNSYVNVDYIVNIHVKEYVRTADTVYDEDGNILCQIFDAEAFAEVTLSTGDAVVKTMEISMGGFASEHEARVEAIQMWDCVNEAVEYCLENLDTIKEFDWPCTFD